MSTPNITLIVLPIIIFKPEQQTTLQPDGSSRLPWPRPNCSNTNLNNVQRGIFLDMHNNYRGDLARGESEVNAGRGTAPSAALMYRMKYDCDAESYAHQAVKDCETTPMPEYALGPHKQNIHVLRTVETTAEGAIQNAIATWWRQLADHGLRSNMMFYPSEHNRGVESITDWSKMAWWFNTRLGCAVKNCRTFYLTSCMYSPGGNYDFAYVYRPGPTCSDCSSKCDKLSLCRW